MPRIAGGTAKPHRTRHVPEAPGAFPRNGRDRRSCLGNILESQERHSPDGHARLSEGAERYAALAGQRAAGQRRQDFAGGKDLLGFASRTTAAGSSARGSTRKEVTPRFLGLLLRELDSQA